MRVYVLVKNRAGRDDWVTNVFKAEPVHRGEASRCPVCQRWTSMLRWVPPYRAELERQGPQFGDIAFPWGGDELLISERFYDLWASSDLKGLSGFGRVEVVRVKPVPGREQIGMQPDYYCVEVARSRAAVDVVASEFEWEQPVPLCPECRYGGNLSRWRRVVLDAGSWSGEDIFVARGLNTVLATERFKSFCVDNHMRDVWFVPAERYAHDFYRSHARLRLPPTDLPSV